MNCGLCKKPVNFVHDGVVKGEMRVDHVVCDAAHAALKEADELAAFARACGVGLGRDLASRYQNQRDKVGW